MNPAPAGNTIAQAIQDISGPWMEINLDAVTHNVSQIQQLAGNSRLMPVIKANAYGHGVVEIGRHLEKIGVLGLCVGKIEEAVKLRENGVATPLLSLGLFTTAEARWAISNNVSLALFDQSQLQILKEVRGTQAPHKKMKVHLKIDTGLGRVGVPHHEALPVIRQIHASENIILAGIYTSLTEDPSFDALQLSRFTKICAQAEKEGIDTGYKHTSSSASILTLEDHPFDVLRPGIMIFGCYPSRVEFERQKIKLQPVMTLKARVACAKTINRGEGISYHHSYRAHKPETIVTGGVGYSDGYPISVADNGYVLVHGKRYPLVASVTANHVYVHANQCKDIAYGDEIVLLGKQENSTISVEDLAAWADLSVYQLLSGLNPLIPRFYW